MTGLEFNQALREGRRVYGTLLTSTSPRWVPLIAGLPLDFVFIDTEHIPIDRAQLSWMTWAYRYAGLAPMVRIPSPDPFAACQILDGGACSIVVPYVENAGQVRDLVGAVKHRPLKGVTLAAALADQKALTPAQQLYVETYNRGNSLIVNIESTPALAALDQILAVPGLDGLLVGPHDLSCSLGFPEDYEHPKFQETVADIFRRARAAGVAAGIHSWMPAAQEATWCAAGANLIIHSSDLIATRVTLENEIRALRHCNGDPVASAIEDLPV